MFSSRDTTKTTPRTPLFKKCKWLLIPPVFILVAAIVLSLYPFMTVNASSSFLSIGISTVDAIAKQPPQDFTAVVVANDRIDCTWTRPATIANVMVRAKYGTAPADITDGYLVYYGALEQASDISVDMDQTINQLVYRAWSEDAVLGWSTPAEAIVESVAMNQLVILLILALFKGFAYWHRERWLYVLAGFASLAIGFTYVDTNFAIGILFLAWGGYDFAKAMWDKGKKTVGA